MRKHFLFASLILLHITSCKKDPNGSVTDYVPLPPSGLVITAIGDSSIQLQWTDQSTNEGGFKIERKISSGTFAEIATTSSDVTIYNDKPLMPNTLYAYRVKSFNNAGNSPTYSNEVSATTSFTVTDCDGNRYHTVVIGSQTWMLENLRTTKFRDCTAIPNVTDNNAWRFLTTAAYCDYNNDTSISRVYGRLYNQYAFTSNILPPNGWHIPSLAEWQTLVNYLGGETVAGGALKEADFAHWAVPNTGATNSSGFTALPAGGRGNFGDFGGIGVGTSFWSSGGPNWTLTTSSESTGFAASDPHIGISIRCVKD